MPPALQTMPPLCDFLGKLSTLAEAGLAEETFLDRAGPLLAALVRTPGWLPDALLAEPPGDYAQRLLYRAPDGRLSIVCFVWNPGARTPVHDHGTWGLVGVIEGSEISQRYAMENGRCVPAGKPRRLRRGDVLAISTPANIHQVSNGSTTRRSISIHAYGADIGRIERRIFSADGATRSFRSGYD